MGRFTLALFLITLILTPLLLQAYDLSGPVSRGRVDRWGLKVDKNRGSDSLVLLNTGVRDLIEDGSAWLDKDGSVIGRIYLSTDFIRVEWFSTTLRLYDYNGYQIYDLDFSSWELGGKSLGTMLMSGMATMYYYDWLRGVWRVWQRGVDNATHGMPDFEHPAFRQVFKWMLNIDIGLNITFYMTNHDPYIRILIDSNSDEILITDVNPAPLIRIGLEANISDYSKHLLNWNQANSKMHGNPWAPPAWSDTAQGVIGQIFIMRPSSGVEIKKITNYNQNLNRFVNAHAYNFFNWAENRTENWYSFEFYIRNEKNDAQNVTLENYVPDDIYKVDIYYYDGQSYILIGSWNRNSFGSTTYFTDPTGIEHYFTVHEPIEFGGKTESGISTSQYYGMKKRVLMEFNLSGGYINDPNVFGGSQLRLKFKFYYSDPGYATYLFSTNYNSKYGLANMLSPYILLFNYTMYDRPLFISANFTRANLYIKSDDHEIIRDVGFKIDFSKTDNYLLALGYNGRMDTWRDDDHNNIPDIFEHNAFQWSDEKLFNVSRASLVYYDIVQWDYRDVGKDLVENYAKLEWHGKGIRLFGIGSPYAYGWKECKCILTGVRDINGHQHLMVQTGEYINFKISYDVEKEYYKIFNFGYETSTMEISISYKTRHGYPYKAYTITEIRDLVRRIYRADEIPEGKRNMPDLEYWTFEVIRNDSIDTPSWYIDLRKDVFLRHDQFSSIKYLIKISINPLVNIEIEYDKILWKNNLSVSFDYGYYWDSYFYIKSAYEKVKEVGFVMARRHLFTLYKGIRWPPSPCIEWDPVHHESKGYDWSMLDRWIMGVRGNWSLTPLMSIGGPKYHHTPKNMPKIPLGRDRYLPAAIDFAQYFADVTKHIVVDLNISPIYLEVMNEPYIPNDTVAQMYIELYNMVRRKVAEVLKPYNKSLGKDVFLGINYIDRFTNLKKPFFEYVYEGVDDLEFASVHNYPGGWGHPFSPWVNNPNRIFFPPNNQYGWFTDEVVINRTYQYTYLHGIDPRITFDEMRHRWREKFGHDLILMVTEANLNSAWQGGSDPRQQNLISAVVHAIMLKNYALDGFSQYFFFQLASMHTPDTPMYKYGGFGLAIMNSTPPHKPFAPYLVAYLWGNYMVRGAEALNYSIEGPDVIDMLPVKVGEVYRIWIINKVDSAVTISINLPGDGGVRASAYILDGESYQQRYVPELDRVVFGKRELRTMDLGIIQELNLTLMGYSVVLLELKTEHTPATTTTWITTQTPTITTPASTTVTSLTTQTPTIQTRTTQPTSTTKTIRPRGAAWLEIAVMALTVFALILAITILKIRRLKQS